jgi:integrase
MAKKRANGEGSIYHYKDIFSAYVWVETPDGHRKRKYVYGPTREECHNNWIKAAAEAQKGPVATKTPTVDSFIDSWLKETVKPTKAPLTYVFYEMNTRLFIRPYLGKKTLAKVIVKVAREWINGLVNVCQCCAQEKDAKRKTPKCCAIGQCCESWTTQRNLEAAHVTLSAMLTQAVNEELIGKNVASLIDVPKARNRQVKRKVVPWSSHEAQDFLLHAQEKDDALYAAWILAVVMAMRRGEFLGVTWDVLDLDAGQLRSRDQLQRVGAELLHRETKTEGSDDFLPLPPIVVTALRIRKAQQKADEKAAGDAWSNKLNLVFTTKYGTPYEPANVTRMFGARCKAAGVRVIRLLSRSGARFRCCHRPVSPDRSPNPPCGLLRNGLSTVAAVRRGSWWAMGAGSCCPGTSSGSPLLSRSGRTRPRLPRSATAR